MKNNFFYLLCFISTSFNAQETSQTIGDSIKILRVKTEELQKALAEIPAKISALEERLVVLRHQENITEINTKIGKGLSLKMPASGNMNSTYTDENAIFLLSIPKSKTVTILNADHYPYYLAKYKDKTGYIHRQWLNFSGTIIELADAKAAVESKAPTISYPSPTSYYSPTPSYTPSNSPSSQTIQTGPRGGKYYYTSSGKKRYVSQKKKN